MEITEEWKLERVIDLFPETVRLFHDVGFTDLESPIMRHAAKLVSIKEAAWLMETDLEHLVVRLNQCIQTN
ncbi:MAG TPA: DUF1858 domain-containing protein [Candidatus Nanoarchaeia archaeon]|nr:DUF1858 domain-containing protein [Candidatus Nanoarchaeia archaeon]